MNVPEAELGPQRDAVRFDANLGPHDHYVCVRCGLVRDFESTDLNALRLPEAVRRLGSVVDAHVEVRGICAKCVRKNKSPVKKQRQENPRRRRS